MKNDKEPLHTYIDRDLRTKVDDFIAKTYTKPYGALSYVVEEALRFYLDLERPKNTQIHKKPPNRNHQLCMNIMHDLKKNGFTNQFTINDLGRSIGLVRGTDRRTIDKWCKILETYGYTKFISNRVLTFGPNGLSLVADVSPELLEPVMEGSP